MSTALIGFQSKKTSSTIYNYNQAVTRDYTRKQPTAFLQKYSDYTPNQNKPEKINLFYLLRSSWAWQTMSCIFIQNLISSSSLLFFDRAGKQTVFNYTFYIYLALYIGTFVASRFMESVSAKMTCRWNFALLSSFRNKIINSNYGKTILWNDKKHKNETTAMFANQIPQVVDASINTLTGFSNFGFTALTNVLCMYAFGYLDYGIVLAMLSAGLLTAGIMRWTQQRRKFLSESFQTSNTALSIQANTMWDNTALGNRDNFQNWHNKFNNAFNQQASTMRTYENFNITTNFVSWSATMAPFLLVFVREVYMQAQMKSSDISIADSIAKTMHMFPRLCLASSSVQNFVNGMFYWKDNDRQLTNSIKSFTPNLDLSALSKNINTDLLNLTYNGADKPIKEICSNLDNFVRIGRWTLTGDNGAGKSTLLGIIKQHFGDNAFLLPVKSELDFNLSKSNLSSGEIIMKTFQELDQNKKKPLILLLDEWNANLDARNCKKLSGMIERWSKHHVVIEVTHDSSKLLSNASSGRA